jgi:MFS family permease
MSNADAVTIEPGLHSLQFSQEDSERRGWTIVKALFVIELIIWGCTFHTFGVFFLPLTKQFGVSFARVSVLATTLSLTMGVICPAVGWMLEYIDVRKVMVTGITLLGVSFAIASRAPSFNVLIVAYFILGIGLACSQIVPASVTVANWFGEKRGTALSIVVAGMALGGLLIPPVANEIVIKMGWRASYFILGTVMLVVLIPLVLLFVRTRPTAAIAVEGETGERKRDLPGFSLREAMRIRTLWLVLAFYFIEGFGVNLSHAHLIPYLVLKGYAPERATLFFSFVQGVAVPGCLLLGALGDRLGAKTGIAIGMLLTASGLLMLLGAANPAFVVAFIVLYGSSTAGMAALAALLVAESLGLKRFGLFTGLGMFAVTMGLAVAPPVGGRIFDVWKSYSIAFELGAAFAVIGAIVILAVPPPRFKGITAENAARSAA